MFTKEVIEAIEKRRNLSGPSISNGIVSGDQRSFYDYCYHELVPKIINEFKCDHSVASHRMDKGPIRYLTNDGSFECGKCGVKLKPSKWEAYD